MIANKVIIFKALEEIKVIKKTKQLLTHVMILKTKTMQFIKDKL